MTGHAQYFEDESVVVYHGDCRQLIREIEADVIVTDPPYGMSFKSGYGPSYSREVVGDHDTSLRDEVLGLWSGPALVFGTWRSASPAQTRNVLVWHKTSLGPGLGDLSMPWGHATEEVYVIGSGFVGRRRSNVISTNGQRGSPHGACARAAHPTVKSLDVMRALLDCCPPEWTILDPFMGSGSTLRAAKDLGRKAIGIEIDERYCEIAVERMAQGVLL